MIQNQQIHGTDYFNYFNNMMKLFQCKSNGYGVMKKKTPTVKSRKVMMKVVLCSESTPHISHGLISIESEDD